MAAFMGRDPPLKPPDPHDGGLGSANVGVGDGNPSLGVRSTLTYSGAVSSAKATPKVQFRPRFQPITLPARQVGSKEGRPAISFSGPEVEACAKRYQFSLIAKFTVGRPTIGEIQNAFQSAWNIGGRATLSPIWDARHVLVILDSEADVRIALSSNIHKVGHAFFRLFRWYPEYSPKKESKFSSVWVRLPGLPLTLYDSAFIEAIVSTFGYFVAVEDRTKACVAVQYARTCVELDVTVAVPDSVWIALPNNNGYWQTIEVETKMAYCSKCRMHGHRLSNCRKVRNVVVPVRDRGTHVNEGPHQGPEDTQLGRVDVGMSKKATAGVGATEDDWTKVMAKRDKAKGKKKETFPVVMSKPHHQAVRGVYVIREKVVESNVAEEVPVTGGLEMVPYKEVPPVVNDGIPELEDAIVEDAVTPGVSSSCALKFKEDTGQFVHPAMEEYFNSIQEKAGSCSKEGEPLDTRFVTNRKKKVNKGSKHCRSGSL